MKDNVAIILNSLLYILEKFEGKTTGKHKLFKILYFAEQKHLVKYGKSITNDKYVAMEWGPVPSRSLDIVNCSERQAKFDASISEASKYITTSGYNVIANSKPDLEWLSKSEMACLDESFEENKNLTFGQLTDKSHDLAWKEAGRFMDKAKIANAGGANKEMLKYIASKDELRNLRFL